MDFKTPVGQVGIGMGAGFYTSEQFVPYPLGKVILDVGFGKGAFLRGLLPENEAWGVDLCQESVTEGVTGGWGVKEEFIGRGFDLNPHAMNRAHLVGGVDVCTREIPCHDSVFDIVNCTEAIEHFSSPLHALLEFKRVLKEGGEFWCSVPCQDVNDGYGPGNHAFVYPGLFMDRFWRRFCRQLYLGLEKFKVNGGTALYVFRNYKIPDKYPGKMQNIFEVVAGNPDERDLYGPLMDKEPSVIETNDSWWPHGRVRREFLMSNQKWAGMLRMVRLSGPDFGVSWE